MNVMKEELLQTSVQVATFRKQLLAKDTDLEDARSAVAAAQVFIMNGIVFNK